MDLFAGLFVGGIGLLALLLGYRLFLLLLPLWGFVVGFAVGARLVSVVFDQGFLSDVLGIGVGVAVAILFAGLALPWQDPLIPLRATLATQERQRR